MSKVLLALRDAAIRQNVGSALRGDGIGVREASELAEALGSLVREPVDVFVLDMRLCKVDPEYVIHMIQRVSRTMRIIACTPASLERDELPRAMKGSIQEVHGKAARILMAIRSALLPYRASACGEWCGD